jgi:hypothetical protein
MCSSMWNDNLNESLWKHLMVHMRQSVTKISVVSVRGKVVQDKKKALEVHVEKGMQHGKMIVFQGEVDEVVGFRVLFIRPYL